MELPNRILREGILTSPRIAKLGWADETFYRRLMSVVDDFGRYYADHGLLRAACYPRQLNKVSDSDIGKWLRACVDAALVRVYPAQDGESYLQLLDFRQQTRAKTSKYPAMDSVCVADAEHTHIDGEADAPVFVFGDVVGDVSPQPPTGAVGLMSFGRSGLPTRGRLPSLNAGTSGRPRAASLLPIELSPASGRTSHPRSGLRMAGSSSRRR
ncbi:hypothetical protein X551_04385 [Methylibium sp. T29]|nr:hypothetical protein X551_04385 [Methylibium sp. T29]